MNQQQLVSKQYICLSACLIRTATNKSELSPSNQPLGQHGVEVINKSKSKLKIRQATFLIYYVFSSSR